MPPAAAEVEPEREPDPAHTATPASTPSQSSPPSRRALRWPTSPSASSRRPRESRWLGTWRARTGAARLRAGGRPVRGGTANEDTVAHTPAFNDHDPVTGESDLATGEHDRRA